MAAMKVHENKESTMEEDVGEDEEEMRSQGARSAFSRMASSSRESSGIPRSPSEDAFSIISAEGLPSVGDDWNLVSLLAYCDLLG